MQIIKRLHEVRESILEELVFDLQSKGRVEVDAVKMRRIEFEASGVMRAKALC